MGLLSIFSSKNEVSKAEVKSPNFALAFFVAIVADIVFFFPLELLLGVEFAGDAFVTTTLFAILGRHPLTVMILTPAAGLEFIPVIDMYPLYTLAVFLLFIISKIGIKL